MIASSSCGIRALVVPFVRFVLDTASMRIRNDRQCASAKRLANQDVI